MLENKFIWQTDHISNKISKTIKIAEIKFPFLNCFMHMYDKFQLNRIFGQL